MATEQEKVCVYLEAEQAAAFRALVSAEERTVATVLRRLIREYIASAKAAA